MPKLLICAPCYLKGDTKEAEGLVLVAVCKNHQHLAEEPVKRPYKRRKAVVYKMKHVSNKKRAKRKTMAKTADVLLDLATKGAEFVKKHPEGTATRFIRKEVWTGIPLWRTNKVVQVMKKEKLVRVKGRKLFPLAG